MHKQGIYSLNNAKNDDDNCLNSTSGFLVSFAGVVLEGLAFTGVVCLLSDFCFLDFFLEGPSLEEGPNKIYANAAATGTPIATPMARVVNRIFQTISGFII